MTENSTQSLPRLALTTGEPAGIGIDIILDLAQQPIAAHLVAFGSPELISQRAAQLGIAIELDVGTDLPVSPHTPGQLKVFPVPLNTPVQAGQLNPANATYVLDMLRLACEGCLQGTFDALVTAPVHKSVINQAGIAFSGHTEFFAEYTETPQVVMMLASPQLRVALVTTHMPLAAVPAAITPSHLSNVVRIVQHDLQNKFGISQPHLLVCGLNPHAGEDGHMGREEIEVINPVLDALRDEGMDITGTVPADTAFTPKMLTGVDAVVAMFHDQGLPVLKQQGFGEAVNITLGLPIIRTSVDHGTALDLAGTGHADSGSLWCAVNAALEMLQRRVMT